jgi:hypothetical protein
MAPTNDGPSADDRSAGSASSPRAGADDASSSGASNAAAAAAGDSSLARLAGDSSLESSGLAAPPQADFDLPPPMSASRTHLETELARTRTPAAAEPDPDDPVVAIQTRLAHLRWRKAQNSSKIRSLIDSSKMMADADVLAQTALNPWEKRHAREQEVIAEELQKPLNVDEKFLQRYEKEVHHDNAHYRKQAKTHMRSLKRLERDIAAREAQRKGRATGGAPLEPSVSLASIGQLTLRVRAQRKAHSRRR